MSVTPGAPPARPPALTAPPAGPGGRLALRAGLALALSAALAAGVGLLTRSHAPAPAPAAPNAATPRVATVRAVPAAESARFAVLRAPHGAADAIDPIHPGSGPMGANPALARTVREPRGGLSAGLVAVVPARGAVCLRVPFGHQVAQWWCQRTALAARGHLLMAVRPAGRLRASMQLLIGLVPDGVRSVLVRAAHGVRRIVAVRRNVYETQIYAPRRVTIALPGHRVVSYPAP